MSKEMLKTVLKTKEASVMDVLRGSLKRALGASAGAGAAVPTLEAIGLEQSNPLFWGLVTGAGVLSHDLAGAAGKGYSKHLQKVSCARRDKKILLQKLGKCSKGRKKRAEMIKEGPYKKEYSLTKKANLLSRLGYVGVESAPILAGIHYGGKMGMNLLPESPIAGTLLGAMGLSTALGSATSGLGKTLFPKGRNYFKGVQARQLAKHSSVTKQAGLSRAAKGAIAAPLGVMGAAAIAPSSLFGEIGSTIATASGGKLLDPTASQKILDTLIGTGSRIGFNPHMNHELAAALGTAGISGLGAGAGKLSERFIPVAKKSILEDPKKKKMLMAAALFPWMSTAAGVTYLVNKARNSDS
jgi:hypothetical protein